MRASAIQSNLMFGNPDPYGANHQSGALYGCIHAAGLTIPESVTWPQPSTSTQPPGT